MNLIWNIFLICSSHCFSNWSCHKQELQIPRNLTSSPGNIAWLIGYIKHSYLHHVPVVVLLLNLVLSLLHTPLSVHQELVVVSSFSGVLRTVMWLVMMDGLDHGHLDVDPVGLSFRFRHLDTFPVCHCSTQIDIVSIGTCSVPSVD